MKTTQKGLISEAKVLARLVELGAKVLLPYGHDHPYDIAADVDGRLVRIQVKTARPCIWRGKPNGSVMASGTSIVDRVGGKVTKVLTPEDCDFIAAY